MKISNGHLVLSPTDVANFLACSHKTTLDLRAAKKEIAPPVREDPLAAVLRDRGEAHERRYIEALRSQGLRIVDLTRPREERLPDAAATAETRAAMQSGADVIVQAPLGIDRWFGYADVLRRVEGASALGDWHYEVHDTKLTRETKGGTILQLSVYTEIVGAIQQRTPDRFVVVTPEHAEVYRFDEFAAFYRFVVRDLGDMLSSPRETYPNVVDHCGVCRWWETCNRQRRQDDHLSFVAGLGRAQENELRRREIETMAALAALPVPMVFAPDRGSVQTYERLREQARLQVEQRTRKTPVHELLPVEASRGLCLLPEPSPGDLFLDLEGDPFGRIPADGGSSTGAGPGQAGREYLFGLGSIGADGSLRYRARWAFNDAEERAGFDAVVADMMAAIADDPGAHIYHYAPYEPAAMKRLMGRHLTRESDIDALLRGRRFVDLFAVVRQSLRAGVEGYSIKQMEPFYRFVRDVDLDDAGDQRRLVELALETGDFSMVTPSVTAAVEGYNRDDCRSTRDLRAWLETLRQEAMQSGANVLRPAPEAGDAPEKVGDRQQRIETLRARLLALHPMGDESGAITPEQRACWLLAHLLDWQYREDKAAWWDYYRLVELPGEDLADEPAALTGLEHVGRLNAVLHKTTGKPTGSVIDRYKYPAQETDLRRKQDLSLFGDGKTFGRVVAVDRSQCTFDVKKGKGMADVHPFSVFAHDGVPPDTPARSLFRLGEFVAAYGIAGPGLYRAGRDLLLGRSPQVGNVPLDDVPLDPDESMSRFAVRIAPALNESVLPIQGPPGSGKTFTGARMIAALVREGRRVGVTATSHKVVRLLLDAVAAAAAEHGEDIRIGQKVGDEHEAQPGVPGKIAEFRDNDEALAALQQGDVQVLGGTAWLWAREDFAVSVDVLVVDEAGQMALANVLAVSPAAKSLVLLGDPQQLEQPQKGSHPDGVDVSALQHVLGSEKTMPSARGLFLPITWRLPPAICAYTSAAFYDGKLHAKPGLEGQQIAGSERFGGAGLFVVEVGHDGCRNASDEEVAVVSDLVDELLSPGVAWIDQHGVRARLTPSDILVVAPYNAHVARLRERLDARHVQAGTVDRFQGQEAPVVIYSMATSRPEDAPRGMEFLYSLNRFNVATSRAKALSILVASPRLFEPECQTPRQMRLANALCWYRDLARVVP